MVVAEALTGMSALKTAFDMTKALKDINDATIRNGAVIELQEKILSAQEAQFSMSKKFEEMAQELATLKNEKSKLERYRLKDFGGNTFAYELKESKANGEPLHRACPTCFQNGKISVLQFSHRADGGQDWYECLECEKRMPFGQRHGSEYSHRSHAEDF